MGQIIEAAILAGYEPSGEDLTEEQIFTEARTYLTDIYK